MNDVWISCKFHNVESFKKGECLKLRHLRCLVGPVGICINVYVSKYIANNVILPIISITETVKVNKANVSRVQCSKKDDVLCFARALIGIGH